MAVLFDSREVDDSVKQVLDDHKLRLEAPVWESARPETACSSRLALRVIDLPDSLTTARAYELIKALRDKEGVLAAGEALSRDDGSVTFYSGHVIVRFEDPAQSARAWADANDGWSLVQRLEDGRYLFRAELEPARLLALAGAPSSPFDEVRPILRTVGRVDPGGVFHRIPRDRNVLAVVYVLGEDRTLSDHIIESYDGVRISDPSDDDVEVFRFPDECTMMQAQAALRATGAAPEVIRTGPVVSLNPLAFLSGQIVIRFRHSSRPDPDAIPLLASYGLVWLRNLSYVSRGKLYTAPVPSYALYDLARQLIPDYADIAIPNLFSRNRSESCDGSTCSLDFPNQEYLEQMNVCGSWLEDAEHDPVLGVLDSGFAGDLAYDRLHVVAGIELDTMKDCVRGSTGWEDPAVHWKDASCNSVWNNTEHGLGVALTAAAQTEDDDSDGNPDDDLRGVAPGIKLINAGQKTDLKTDIAMADTLWWMGGGDPGWCRDEANYACPCTTTTSSACAGTVCVAGTSRNCVDEDMPGPLDEETRADVINLSFDRENFEEVNCTDHGVCYIVCDEGVDPCGVMEHALQTLHDPAEDLGIRDGGVLVVAAAGLHSTADDPWASENQRCEDCDVDPNWVYHTALPESTATVGVGTVTTSGQTFNDLTKECDNDPDGSPARTVSCKLSHPGPFLDVVAPIGGENGTTLYCDDDETCEKKFGGSSGATAAVSGVAAMMFRVNSRLTAPQALCILRQTANQAWSSSTLGGWEYYDPETDSMLPCSLDDEGHSDCVGYGMVDACRAVDVANSCGYCTVGTFSFPDMKSRGTVEVPCFSRFSSLHLPASCLCDVDGNPIEPEFPSDPFEACPEFECGRMSEKNDAIASEVMRLVACVTEQRCLCDRPDCLDVEIVNHGKAARQGVRMMACVQNRCWEELGNWESWPSGAPIRVTLPTSPEILSAWRNGKTVHLRAFDRGGNRIHFRGSAGKAR